MALSYKPFIYNSHIETIASKARVAESNEDLASICRRLNVADEIYLGKVDLWLAKHALSALYRTLKRYSHLRSVVNYFGTLNGFIQTKESVNRQINRKNNFSVANMMQKATNNIVSSCWTSFQNDGLAFAFHIEYGDCTFRGIIINGKSLNQQSILENLEFGEERGHSPKGCNSIKSVIEHEIGHLFDFMLGISHSREFIKAIKQYTPKCVYDNLSHYCVSGGIINFREVVAEGYSEYCNNSSPRPISLLVGELINKKYEEMYNEW